MRLPNLPAVPAATAQHEVPQAAAAPAMPAEVVAAPMPEAAAPAIVEQPAQPSPSPQYDVDPLAGVFGPSIDALLTHTPVAEPVAEQIAPPAPVAEEIPLPAIAATAHVAAPPANVVQGDVLGGPVAVDLPPDIAAACATPAAWYPGTTPPPVSGGGPMVGGIATEPLLPSMHHSGSTEKELSASASRFTAGMILLVAAVTGIGAGKILLGLVA
jgi:hypothetical protein